jgi:hypothetical protein
LLSASCSSPKIDTESTQTESIETAIKRSAKYLQKSVKENGMFEYRINMDLSVKVKHKYNILRHSGAIYAMSQYLELYPGDRGMRSAIARAGKYLRNEAIAPISENQEMLAVWSKPQINNSSKPPQAKLGGTGLGLIALLSIEKFHPGFTPLPDLRKLGMFIVYMLKEDGSFYSKYIPSEGGRQDRWKSLYYPGEAALGLLMLYEKDPSAIWADTAYKALEYIATNAGNKNTVVVDHWFLIATEKLLNVNNIKLTDAQKDLLISHTMKICNTILNEQIISHRHPEFRGGYSIDGRITPTSIRLEGLLAASSFLPLQYRQLTGIDRAIVRGMSFLLNAQIKDGEYIGAYPRALKRIEENSDYIKQFNRRVTEIRIDYVQHALSAMIGYANFLGRH